MSSEFLPHWNITKQKLKKHEQKWCFWIFHITANAPVYHAERSFIKRFKHQILEYRYICPHIPVHTQITNLRIQCAVQRHTWFFDTQRHKTIQVHEHLANIAAENISKAIKLFTREINLETNDVIGHPRCTISVILFNSPNFHTCIIYMEP